MRKLLVSIVVSLTVACGLAMPASASGLLPLDSYLVTDLNQKSATLKLHACVPFNGWLYCSGYGATYGDEIYRLKTATFGNRGVFADAELGIDLLPNGSSYPAALTVFQNNLYFTAVDNAGVRKLIRATPDGQLTDVGVISQLGQNGFGQSMGVFNNHLYVYRKDVSSPHSGTELWSYDGSNWTKLSNPGAVQTSWIGYEVFQVYNNKLYFGVTRSDGDAVLNIGVVGTDNVISDAPNTSDFRGPSSMSVFNGKLMFIASGPAGQEYYSYDGVNAPVAVDASGDPGTSGMPWPGVSLNGNFFFGAGDSTGNYVYKWSGTGAPVKMSVPGTTTGDSLYISDFQVLNNRVYFTVAAMSTGSSYLYSTDGTTIRREDAVGEAFPGEIRGTPQLDGRGIVNVYEASREGMYFYDGTTLIPIINIGSGTADGLAGYLMGNDFAVTSDSIFFAGFDGSQSGLFKYSGTRMPTLVPGSLGLFPYSLYSSHNAMYAYGYTGTGMEVTQHIYKYNGTGMEIVTALDPVIASYGVAEFMELNSGTVIKSYATVAYMNSSGTVTTLDPAFSQIGDAVRIGSYYYFYAANGISGAGIYRWNGTTSPTLYSSLTQSIRLFNVNGALYSYAYLDSATGFYSVTDSNVTLVGNVDVPGMIQNRITIGAKSYFSIRTDSGQSQLWQVSSSGMSQIELPDDLYAVAFLNDVGGKLAVSGSTIAGYGWIYIYDLSGVAQVESRVETSYANEGQQTSVVTFQGELYFGKVDGYAGFELASTAESFAATPPSSPRSLVVSNPTDYSATLNWIAPTQTGGHPLANYLIEYSPDLTGDTWMWWGRFATTDTSAVITGLLPNTTYRFRVSAITFKGNSAPTDQVTIKTLLYKPSAPRGVKVAAKTITKNSAVVTWSAPATQGSGPVTDYKVETSTNGKKWTAVSHRASTARSLKIAKLKGKTKYFVRVTAVTAYGNGATSAKVSFKTK
jgi:hypothetical protein